jgi:hypothetical protein
MANGRKTGWNIQRETTHPGEVPREEFMLPQPDAQILEPSCGFAGAQEIVARRMPARNDRRSNQEQTL